MAQSKEFVDASHALNDLSHALALLESENASLRGAVDGLCNDNDKLRELVRNLLRVIPRDVSGVVIGARHEHPTYYSFADAIRELGVEAE